MYTTLEVQNKGEKNLKYIFLNEFEIPSESINISELLPIYQKPMILSQNLIKLNEEIAGGSGHPSFYIELMKDLLLSSNKFLGKNSNV